MNTLKKLAALCMAFVGCNLSSAERPNIVWIIGEDMGPELGCYGDANAITPNIDRLAAEGARFTRAFAHAPVCAPARSGLITGMYPTTIGTHHMRSELLSPPRTFTSYLRDAGYHVAWPGKTDFNFKVPPEAFDSKKGWIQEPPSEPFFAYVNFNVSHESRIRYPEEELEEALRDLQPEERRDPANMEIPPYHPDAPEVRHDLANYYDLVTAVDYKVGEVLAALEKHGLAENTVVLFTGDHGRGLPRSKRWVYDSGIHVPLILRWPGMIEPETIREELVSFVDFAPTMLALAGLKVPDEMQGQVFLGSTAAPEREYIFAARDRMDETYDRIRAVRDKQFKYIRNFHPELPYAQRIAYGELMPTMQVWRRWHEEGKLSGPQTIFFASRKPAEELYDLNSDPHEINNIVDSPRPMHQEKLKQLRAALDQWIEETGDLGEVPEEELIQRGLVADRLKDYEERRRTGMISR